MSFSQKWISQNRRSTDRSKLSSSCWRSGARRINDTDSSFMLSTWAFMAQMWYALLMYSVSAVLSTR